MRHSMLILSLGLTAGLLAVGGCSTNPVTGERQLSLISTEQEIAMGREAGPEFEKEFGGKVDDAVLQEYVNRVGLAVAARSHRQELPYHFALLNSDVPNAFALPGGFIYITRGLFERMDNEAQLAAVLAHEVGHVAYQHNTRALQQAIGLQLLVRLAGIAIGGDAGAAAEAGAKIAAGMVQLKYSRGNEYDSDAIGLLYMTQAGYNPWGMVQLLNKLNELHEGKQGRLDEMFQTHPLTTNRIDRIRKEVQKDHLAYAEADTRDLHPEPFLKMRARLE